MRTIPLGVRRNAAARVPRLALLLICATAACSRSEADWLADSRADDPFVRSLAVVALGQAEWDDPERVVEALIQALGDSDPSVATRAGEALLSQEERVLPMLLAQSGWPEADVRKQLDRLVLNRGEQAIPLLREALSRAQPQAGGHLVNLLGQLGSAGQAALLEASHHQSERIRHAALSQFSSHAQRDAAQNQRLAQALDDPAPAIRITTLETVARSKSLRQFLARSGTGVIPRLLERLEDKHEGVRLTAAHVLVQIGVTDAATLDTLALRARTGDDLFHRALGMAAVAGWLQQLSEADTPAQRSAVKQTFVDWGLPARAWLSELAESPRVPQLRARAQQVLIQLDEGSGD